MIKVATQKNTEMDFDVGKEIQRQIWNTKANQNIWADAIFFNLLKAIPEDVLEQSKAIIKHKKGINV